MIKREARLDFRQLLMTIWDFCVVDRGNVGRFHGKRSLEFSKLVLFCKHLSIFLDSGYWAGGQLMKVVGRSKLDFIVLGNLGKFSII